MMRTIGTFVVALYFLTALTCLAADGTDGSKPLLTESEIGWRITNARTVKQSPVVRMALGTIVDEYIVAGDVEAVSKATPIQKGKVRFTVNLFSPARDMPGQKAGLWYLQGTWTITADNADPDLVRIRHNPFAIEGDIKAELANNPADQPTSELEARVYILNSLAAGRWTNGHGIYNGNGTFEGSITLDIETHPDLSPPEK